jgi:hypothetical protein
MTFGAENEIMNSVSETFGLASHRPAAEKAREIVTNRVIDIVINNNKESDADNMSIPRAMFDVRPCMSGR